MESGSPYHSEDDPDYEFDAEEETDDDESSSAEDDGGASAGASVAGAIEIQENAVHDTESSDEWQGEESSSSSSEEEIDQGGAMEGVGPSGHGNPNGEVELDRSVSPNCPVCFEPWTPEGPHRVCCITCGHVYGRSCLERWVQQYGKSTGKCPVCNRKFKPKEIINLFAPLIAVQNDELEKEVCTLREKNEQLQVERGHLLEEIRKQRKHRMDREYYGRPHAPPGATRRRFEYIEERSSSYSQPMLGNNSLSQNHSRRGCRRGYLSFQNELVVEDARVMGIDASRQILLISGKRSGVVGEHVLNKISLASYEIHKIMLPPNTGAIRDLCVLPNGLALFASLGKKLSLFSMGNDNVVLKYNLPGPAWSCSGDVNSQYHIYAGLQNGMLLVFDIRQTATHLDSMEGLSRHPIHTIHSIVCNDNTKKVLTASSLGPCVWDVGSSGQRPFLIPELQNQGICISLAYSCITDDMVASFRPKVGLPDDTFPSQSSVSPSPPVSGSGKLGSHVLIKRINGGSFQKQYVAFGRVSEVRMSKSAIICSERNEGMFAYGDESNYGLCSWDLPTFHEYTQYRPHRHPILDLKYARCTIDSGVLGCISEDRLQVFTCYFGS